MVGSVYNVAVKGKPPAARGLNAEEALGKAHELAGEHGPNYARIYDPVGGWTLARVWPDGGVDVVGVAGKRVYGKLVSTS